MSFTVVNHQVVAPNSGSATISYTVQGGAHTIILAINSATAPSAVSGLGATWVKDADDTATSFGNTQTVWRGSTATAGAGTITLTGAGNVRDISGVVVELSGAQAASPVDSQNTGTFSTASASVNVTDTIAHANSFAVAILGDVGNSDLAGTPSAPWVSGSGFDSGVSGMGWAYQNLAPTGALSGTFTYATTDRGSWVVVAYAPGAPPGPTPGVNHLKHLGWAAVLNSLAGTSNLGPTAAANAWAGSKGLDCLGALNYKNGWRPPNTGKLLSLDGVCNALAGTKGLGAEGALNYLNGTY